MSSEPEKTKFDYNDGISAQAIVGASEAQREF